MNFKKGVAHMSIPLYGFLMHQIFKMKLPTLGLLMSDRLKDPEFFELVKTYKDHAHSRTC